MTGIMKNLPPIDLILTTQKLPQGVEKTYSLELNKEPINELGPFEAWLLKNMARINVNGQQIKGINFDNNMISIEVDGLFMKIQYDFPLDGDFTEDITMVEGKMWNPEKGTK